MKKEQDPMGAAILSFYQKGSTDKLRVLSSLFDEDEIPVSYLFRTFEEMPPLEQKALELARGTILDVGAGAGCHSIVLQDMGKNVEAIDISSLSVLTMRKRGIKHVRVANLFEEHNQKKYDTILLLMNGIGMIGQLKFLDKFFTHLKNLLSPNGQVLLDSSDLSFIFEEEEKLEHKYDYYGEIDYQMIYNTTVGEPFFWLYLDFYTLKEAAQAAGFQTELLQEGSNHDYLARLTLVK